MATEKKRGRPTAFKPEYAPIAKQLCKLGATDKQIAEAFGVSEQTVNTWKQLYPVFLESLKEGKDFADSKVQESLYQRAIGCSHPDTHVSNFQGIITKTPLVKHYPPDTTACIFWLKNRRPKDWRDRVEHSHEGKDGAALFSPELIAAAAKLAKAL